MSKKTQSAKREISSSDLRREGRYAYEGLERLFHEKGRLGIVTSFLANGDSLSFGDLRALCSLSDGNLNRHLDALKKANVVSVEREGSGRNARSTCTLTEFGKRSFAAYLDELQQVLADAERAQATSKSKAARANFST